MFKDFSSEEEGSVDTMSPYLEIISKMKELQMKITIQDSAISYVNFHKIIRLNKIELH